jgi:hypothetical protein
MKRFFLKKTANGMHHFCQVAWGINLEITIVRRIDKKSNETIVFQAAIYNALPREELFAMNYLSIYADDNQLNASYEPFIYEVCIL